MPKIVLGPNNAMSLEEEYFIFRFYKQGETTLIRHSKTMISQTQNYSIVTGYLKYKCEIDANASTKAISLYNSWNSSGESWRHSSQPTWPLLAVGSPQIHSSTLLRINHCTYISTVLGNPCVLWGGKCDFLAILRVSMWLHVNVPILNVRYMIIT